jgi:hypothetical protein
MAFPINYQGYPNVMGIDASGKPWVGSDAGNMGGFPLAMGVSGSFPSMEPFSFMDMPSAIDPMTGMALNPAFNNTLGMPFPSNFSSLSPLIGSLGRNASFMTEPPAIAPMMDIPLDRGSTNGFMNPVSPDSQPEQAQPDESPIKQMFMMLFKIKLIQQMMNREQESVTEITAAQENESEAEELEASETDSTVTEPITDNVTALDILSDSKNFKAIAGDDEEIDFLDISRAARTAKDGEIKAAAEYIKGNLKLFKQLVKLSHPGDGAFTEDDLGKALQSDKIVQGTSQEGSDTLPGGEGNDTTDEDGEEKDVKITDNVTALDTFLDRFEDLDENTNGQVTLSELSKAASGEEDPELKALAKYLRTRGLFTEIDAFDDKAGISVKDINDALVDPQILDPSGAPGAGVIDVTGVTDEQAVKTINQNFAVIDALKDPKKADRVGLSDKLLSVEDLDAVLNSRDKSVTEEMKKAAQVMKNNTLIAKIDKAGTNNPDTPGDETKDGLISKDEIQAWANDYAGQQGKADVPKNLKDAMVILNRAGAGNVFGADKKKFTFDEVRAAVNKSGIAADVKGALQYLIDHKEGEFDKLDMLDQSDDDAVQVDVIPDAAVEGASLEYFGTTPTEQNNRKALTILDDIYDQVDVASKGGSPDKTISEEDMKAALADRSGKYTAKQKSALRYMLNVRQGGDTLWESMDGDDDKIEKTGFQALVNGSDTWRPEDIKPDSRTSASSQPATSTPGTNGAPF